MGSLAFLLFSSFSFSDPTTLGAVDCDIFLGGGKGSLVPLCFFHADKRLFNSFVLITSDCRLFIEELDRGDSIGERGLDRLSMLNSQNNKRKLALCVSNELDVTC